MGVRKRVGERGWWGREGSEEGREGGEEGGGGEGG